MKIIYTPKNLKLWLIAILTLGALKAYAQVPVAKFGANKLSLEIYDQLTLSDSSSNTPFSWEWIIYDSVTFKNDPYDKVSDPDNGWISFDNGTTKNSKNPQITIYREGKYTVALRCYNKTGWSTKLIKKDYITARIYTSYYLGFGSYGSYADNIVSTDYGEIYDNGGKNANYGNNQGIATKSFLTINPCRAKKITLKMQQLKFSDNQDVLYVYDDNKVNSAKLLAAWTKGNTSNTTVTALSGSMYLVFKTNGSGVDSGFIGSYTSILDSSAFKPSIDFIHDSVIYKGVPTIITSVNTSFPGTPVFDWKVDGTFSGVGKIFKTVQDVPDGIYQVCMRVRGCKIDTNICKYIKIKTPNAKTTINFSKTTLSSNSDTAWLKPLTDKANRFSWSISPTTYILLNAPISPSIVKPGLIEYREIRGDSVPTPHIWFLDSTCYNITLKAWYDKDSSTTVSTLTKNSYVCSKDFRLTYGLFGKVFKDNNSDCSYTSGETYFKDVPIKLYDTTNQFLGQTYTLSNGMFFFDKTNGKYKVVMDIKNLPLDVNCPTGIDSTITLKSSILSGGIDFPTTCGKTDAGVKSILPRGYVFPGKTHNLQINAGLFGKTAFESCQSISDSGIIRVTVTGKIKYSSASHTPSSISGNTYTWKIKDFLKFNNFISMQFKTDTNATYGDTVLAIAEIILSKKDKDSTNNKMKFSYKIMNSYDPNKKETYPETVLPGYKDWFDIYQ